MSQNYGSHHLRSMNALEEVTITDLSQDWLPKLAKKNPVSGLGHRKTCDFLYMGLCISQRLEGTFSNSLFSGAPTPFIYLTGRYNLCNCVHMNVTSNGLNFSRIYLLFEVLLPWLLLLFFPGMFPNFIRCTTKFCFRD